MMTFERPVACIILISFYTTVALPFGSTEELLLDGVSITLSLGGQLWISRYATRKAIDELDQKVAAMAKDTEERRAEFDRKMAAMMQAKAVEQARSDREAADFLKRSGYDAVVSKDEADGT
jgi:hypothetical protein